MFVLKPTGSSVRLSTARLSRWTHSFDSFDCSNEFSIPEMETYAVIDLLRFRKVSLQIGLIDNTSLSHRRGAEGAEEAQRLSYVNRQRTLASTFPVTARRYCSVERTSVIGAISWETVLLACSSIVALRIAFVSNDSVRNARTTTGATLPRAMLMELISLPVVPALTAITTLEMACARRVPTLKKKDLSFGFDFGNLTASSISSGSITV